MDFERWFVAQLPQLVRFATVVSGSADLADDLVQEVALRAQQRWPKLSRLDHRDAYLRRMLVNEHLSFRRRAARHSLRDVVVPDASDDRPAFADQHAERSALLRELDQLSPRQRTILVLRYFEDADDATIAQLLGCRQSTVRAHAARGLQTLRIRRAADETRPHPATTTPRQEDTRAH